MSQNPIQQLNSVDEATLEWLATKNNVYKYLEETEGEHEHEVLNISQEIIEALSLIGPYTMDDSIKWNSIQHVLSALVLIDRHSGLDHPIRLPTEQCNNHSNPQARGPHYDPINEVEQLDEPTVEKLGEKYGVDNVIEYTPEGSLHLAIQRHLGQSLLELIGSTFPTQYELGQSILAAMVRVDRLIGGKTSLKLEDIVSSYRLPPTDGEEEGELMEYDTQALTTTVTR